MNTRDLLKTAEAKGLITSGEANGDILAEFIQSTTQKVVVIVEKDGDGVPSRLRMRRVWRKTVEDEWKVSKCVYISTIELTELLPALKEVVEKSQKIIEN